MLTITIDLHVDVIAIMLGILMPSLNSTANPQVLRKIEYINAILATQLKRIVFRTVIDHNVVIAGLFDAPHGLDNTVLLIVSRDDNQHLWGFVNHS